jgi:cystathionine beta-lyase/cystathionine gamma-synthase
VQEKVAAIREVCPNGFGGMLTFEVEGGDEAALKFLERLTIPEVATSLGGVESMVSSLSCARAEPVVGHRHKAGSVMPRSSSMWSPARSWVGRFWIP